MPLTADVCKLKHLDRFKILKEAELRAENFWENYNNWLSMKKESEFRNNVSYLIKCIKNFREDVISMSLDKNTLNAINSCLERLDFDGLIFLIENKIEPKNKQVAAMFRYIFSRKNVFETLKENNIFTEKQLNEIFNKYASESFGEESFSSKWSKLNWEVRDKLFSLNLIKISKNRVAIKDSEGKDVLIKDNWPGEKTRMVTMYTEPEFEYNFDFTLEDLKKKYRWSFEWGTWAVLDEKGWHEKGNMGWFATSDATEEDCQNWNQGFYENFLQGEDLETTLVLVDCHI